MASSETRVTVGSIFGDSDSSDRSTSSLYGVVGLSTEKIMLYGGVAFVVLVGLALLARRSRG